MEYKSRQWHEKCFSCCVCKTPIGTKSFIEKSEFVNALLVARNERNDISGDNMKVQSGTCSVGIEMNNHDDASARCCAECGKEGGVSLKTCKACMLVKYCNAKCQKIGRDTRKYVSNVLPSYMTRLCSRTHRPRRIVPFASYPCRRH